MNFDDAFKICAEKQISEIGEYAIHKWLASYLENNSPNCIQGVGDDCAVLEIGTDEYLLVTTDRIPLITDPSEIGRFVVIHNVSDIIAMRGRPLFLLLNIYIPRESPIKQFTSIVAAAKETSQKYGMSIVGGDTKEDSKLTVLGTGLGLVSKQDLLLRSGARPGNAIVITKSAGKSLGMRWAYWVSNYFDVCLDDREFLRNAYFEQLTIPFEIMEQLRGKPGITSCIDMTEGLLGASQIISEVSGVSLVLSEKKLFSLLHPKTKRVSQTLHVNPLFMLFNPGFDWENLLTIESSEYPTLRKVSSNSLIEIGRIEEGSGIFLEEEAGSITPLRIFSDQKFTNLPWKDNALAWRNFNFLEK